MRDVIARSFTWSADKEIEMVVRRGEEEITLDGKAGTPTLQVETIVPVQGVSSTKSKLRESWLKG